MPVELLSFMEVYSYLTLLLFIMHIIIFSQSITFENSDLFLAMDVVHWFKGPIFGVKWSRCLWLLC